MRNIISCIKKNDIITCFITFFLIIFTVTQFFPMIMYYDYLWNFQSIFKMNNGLKIYSNINVIVTPLFFYLGNIFLRIFGANFFGFNIYGAVTNSLLLTAIYMILKNLEISSKVRILTTLGIFTIGIKAIIPNGANYNFLVLFFILIGINLEIKANKKSIKYLGIKQGLVTFLVAFTKHNIGFYYIGAITVYRLITDKSMKVKIKELLEQYIVVGILGLFFLAYLKISNTWDGFFYYVLSGTKDFTKNVFLPLISENDVFYLILPIVVLMFGIIGIRKKIIEKPDRNNIKLLTCMSIAIIGTIIPIANDCHILNIAIINIISLIYIFKMTIKFDSEISNKIFVALISIISIVDILYVSKIIYICKPYKMVKITDINSPFFYTIIPEELNNSINEITKYIKEKQEKGIDVIVLYNLSGQYMIPLKKNNGEFDCINTGNLGKDGAQGLIKKIEKMHDTQFLILTDDDLVFWQEPVEIRNYIKEKLIYTGEINEFSIYTIK